MWLLRKPVVVLCCILSIAGGCHSGFAQTAAPATGAQIAIEEAEQAGTVWLGVMDSGHYAEGWKAADPVVQSAVTEEKWTATMNNTREPLGKMTARKVQSATHTTVLPGVPDGDYVVILYGTGFEHKRAALETVILSRQKDKAWRVAGYYIK